MGKKGSLPLSQEPSDCPYPQPEESNPYHPQIIFLRTNLLLLSQNKILSLAAVIYTTVQVPKLLWEFELIATSRA
jgi:hypothetical protein